MLLCHLCAAPDKRSFNEQTLLFAFYVHREFVKTGFVPETLGRFYDLLFDNRQRGDYDDFVALRQNKSPLGRKSYRRNLSTTSTG